MWTHVAMHPHLRGPLSLRLLLARPRNYLSASSPHIVTTPKVKPTFRSLHSDSSESVRKQNSDYKN